MAKYKVGDILKFSDEVGIIAKVNEIGETCPRHMYLVLTSDDYGWNKHGASANNVLHNIVTDSYVYKNVKPKNRDRFTWAFYTSEYTIDTQAEVLPQTRFSEYFERRRDVETKIETPKVNWGDTSPWTHTVVEWSTKPRHSFDEAIRITREIENHLSQIKAKLDKLEELGCDVFVENVEGELIRVTASKGVEEYAVYGDIAVE